MRNKVLTVVAAMALVVGTAHTAQITAFDKIPGSVTLFKNVKVFNGTDNTLHDVEVLIVKNKIHKIAKQIPVTGTWELDVKTGGVKQLKSPLGGLGEYTFVSYSEINYILLAGEVFENSRSDPMFDKCDCQRGVSLAGTPAQARCVRILLGRARKRVLTRNIAASSGRKPTGT